MLGEKKIVRVSKIVETFLIQNNTEIYISESGYEFIK